MTWLRRIRRRSFLLCCCVFLAVPPVSAQVAVGTALGQNHQEARPLGSPNLYPGLGGDSLAMLLFLDTRLSRTTAIGGEVSAATGISGSQSERVPGGTNQLQSRHRDIVLSVVVKPGTPLDRPFRLAGVAGAGVARRATDRTGTHLDFNGRQPETPLPPTTLTDWAYALSGGADAVMALGKHLDLLGAFRLHHIFDADREGSLHQRGVSSNVIRWSAGVQVRF